MEEVSKVRAYLRMCVRAIFRGCACVCVVVAPLTRRRSDVISDYLELVSKKVAWRPNRVSGRARDVSGKALEASREVPDMIK